MELVDRPNTGWGQLFGGEVFFDGSKSSSGDVLGSVQRDYVDDFRFGNDGGRSLLGVGYRFDYRRGVFKLIDKNGKEQR